MELDPYSRLKRLCKSLNELDWIDVILVSFSNDPHCHFSGCSSGYEAELAIFVESVSSSTGTNRGLKYSLSHALFSETVCTVTNQIQGPC